MFALLPLICPPRWANCGSRRPPGPSPSNLSLQVCSFLLTKGDDEAPYRNNTALSLRAEAKQLLDRDEKKVVCETMYNSDNGCITISVIEELRKYTATHFLDNWTKTHDQNPKYRNFRDFPYEIEFATLKQEEDKDGDEDDGETNKAQEKRKRYKSKGGKGGKGKEPELDTTKRYSKGSKGYGGDGKGTVDGKRKGHDGDSWRGSGGKYGGTYNEDEKNYEEEADHGKGNGRG
jgi:hypothetical protein